MSLLRTFACVATVVLLSSSVTLGTAQGAPTSLPPRPNFSKMMFLTGSWSCSVTGSQPALSYRVKPIGSISSDGFWLIRRATITASWKPHDMKSEDWITYDRAAAQWIRINTNDEGGYGVSISPGWSGNSIAWTNVAIVPSRSAGSANVWTMTKVSDTETTSKTSIDGHVTGTSTCRKIS